MSRRLQDKGINGFTVAIHWLSEVACKGKRRVKTRHPGLLHKQLPWFPTTQPATVARQAAHFQCDAYPELPKRQSVWQLDWQLEGCSWHPVSTGWHSHKKIRLLD
jgi:hypothetical protein